MRLFTKPLVALLCLAFLVGQGCTRTISQEARQLSEDMKITIWSVIDDKDVYDDILTSFRQSYPYATIDFKRFRLEEYEDALLNAMAEGRGPDIYMVHNTWVGKYLPKMLPAPSRVRVAEQVVTGTLKKEVTLQVQEARTLTPADVRKQFVDVVAEDAIRAINISEETTKVELVDHVVALPMSVDTLALFYNKDLLNAAGIATPPETWKEFQDQVEQLAVVDAMGRVIRAGAGFGTGENVERSPDVVSLLMMQNRTEMADDNGFPRFQVTPAAISREVDEPPAYAALRFYTEFADPLKSVYTWNDEQPNSLDAFIQGNSAFFFGYSYHLPLIRARAPKLNLAVTQVPQIAGNPQVNYANYWMWAVSKTSEHPDLSWHLVNAMTNETNVATYLEAAGRPAARRSLVEGQFEDEDIGVFASQVLTAESWYRGVDPRAMEMAFIDMIESVVNKEVDVAKAVKTASEKVSQTIRRSDK